MTLSHFWSAAVIISACFALFTRSGAAVPAALLAGAGRGIELTVALAGPLCLWSGLGELMHRAGLLVPVRRLLRPVLERLFPSCRTDDVLADDLTGNVCANLLGLGNAATPMGIRAAGRLRNPGKPGIATDELCRLVVMNTASIQLLPTTVAAVRQSAGASAPFDILPCVWISSLLSVGAGLLAAQLLGRLCRG